jgi:hypothetical protein
MIHVVPWFVLQMEILTKLDGLEHFVRLRHILDEGAWCETVGGVTYVTAVVSPVCTPLESNNSPRDFFQAGSDIAECIDAMASLRIQHRDISPNNFGMYNNRAKLYDTSSSKVGFRRLKNMGIC